MQAAAHGRLDPSPSAGVSRISRPPSNRPSRRASNSPSIRPSPERQPGEHAPAPVTDRANRPGRQVFTHVKMSLSSVLLIFFFFFLFSLQMKTQQSDSSSSCQQVGSPAMFSHKHQPSDPEPGELENPALRTEESMSGSGSDWFTTCLGSLGSRDITPLLNPMRSLTLIVSRVRFNSWLQVSAPARAGQLRAGQAAGGGGGGSGPQNPERRAGGGGDGGRFTEEYRFLKTNWEVSAERTRSVPGGGHRVAAAR